MSGVISQSRGAKRARSAKRVDPESLELGRKIRLLRTDAELTLDALAQRAGVSRSLISQVERGLAQPSLTTLRAIATALEITLAALFHDGAEAPSWNNSQERQYVVRAGRHRHLHLDLPGSEYELLTPDTNRQIELLRARLPPGGSQPAEEGSFATHVGEENAYCISGSLTYLLGTGEFTIHAGDSISFDSSIPHRVENRSSEIAEIIMAMAPPGF